MATQTPLCREQGLAQRLQAAQFVGQLDGRIDPHFFKNVGPVKLHRARRDAQMVGNVLVVMAADEFIEHFALARAQG